MTDQPIVHIRDSRSLDIATYLMLVLLIVVCVIVIPDALTLALAVGLCVVFGVVNWIGGSAITTLRRARIYFVVQTLVLTGLVLLARASDVFGLLFFMLGIQAVLTLPRRAAIAWIVVFYLLNSGTALWFRGAGGVVNVLFNAAVSALTFAFAHAMRRAELARHENEQLVAELRLAQRQVQDLAVAGERNRLALDLHDSVKQQVFATIMQIGAARILVERDARAASERLVEAEQLAQQAGRELTMLIHELRPVALDGRNLAEALRDYATDWSRQSGIAVETQAGDPRTLPTAHEHALLRVSQEALANIARHSQARAVSIDLRDDSTSVTLTISDDGHGFDPVAVTRGVGLHSMRERVEALGGSLQVKSRPGTGTTVIVIVPRAAEQV